MAELTADLILSLDGFAGGVDTAAFFGFSGPELEGWVSDALGRPHVVVMGRVTYEALAQISASATDGISTRMTELPKVVVSNTLQEPLTWPNTRLLRGGPAELQSLKRQSADPLRMIGSLRLLGSLLELGLVDTLRLIICPLLLGGDGREPAYAGYPRTGLDLTGTKVLDSRLVVLEYRPAGGQPG
jgi:dihydrofolate reductase